MENKPVPYQNQLAQQGNKYIELASYPAIRDLDASFVEASIVGIITMACTISGSTKLNSADYNLFSAELYHKIMESYPYITVEEIREAVKCGVYGEYGEYFGVNPKSLFFFVESFFEV